jgi:predicted small lipoprotein YifL
MKSLPCAAAALATFAALVLGGCGQKGPLYLPEKRGTVVTTPAGTAPTAPVPAGQPPQPSPAPQPQSTPGPPPAGTAPPAKNSTEDDDQKPK